MRSSTGKIFILILILFFQGVLSVAQSAGKSVSSNKSAKNKKQTEPKLIKVYLNQKPVFSFTKSAYLHFRDSINTQTKDRLRRMNDHAIEWRKYVAKVPFQQMGKSKYKIFRNQELIDSLDETAYIFFKDSISRKTKDTLFNKADKQVIIHPYDPAHKKHLPTKKSALVSTNSKGYITLNLPLAKAHKYRIVFYESDGSILFELKNIKETELILDKTNFMHAGYFHYELFEDEKLLETGLVNLPK